MVLTWREYFKRAQVLGDWTIWAFMTLLICSQFLGIFYDTSTSRYDNMFGRSPENPSSLIAGFNDEPYSDRSIVCMVQGRSFVPKQLSAVLADPMLSPVTGEEGLAVNALRMSKRGVMTLSPQIADAYASVCDRINFTMTAIQDSCSAIGFNVTRDTLRVIDGVSSTTTQEIPSALPVMIIPFWDNAVTAYYVIPGWQGSACVFRLNGMYQSSTIDYGLFRGVPQSVRESKTVDWLKKPGGTWRNGWYEDLEGTKWFSNMMTSQNGGPFGLEVRQFDTLANSELDCDAKGALTRCKPGLVIETWGSTLTSTIQYAQQDQVFVSTGSRFGLFMFKASIVKTIKTVYTLDTFISNSSIFLILLRWLVSLATMLFSYYRGVYGWTTTGIGCLSGSRTFNLLPLFLLPSLKSTLCAFFTVGCYFEGAQAALSNSWYVVYPAIIEFLLYYFSLLNILGKITYRRVSDVLFGPTLVALCGLHFFNQEIARCGWFGIPGRVTTLILPSEVDTLKVTDFFTTDVALRLNGNVKSIFYIKIGILLLNFVPFIFSDNMTLKRSKKLQIIAACDVERLLALRVGNLGGLGKSDIYTMRSALSLNQAAHSTRATTKVHVQTPPSQFELSPSSSLIAAPNRKDKDNGVRNDHVVIGYEMSRLGFVIFGDKHVLLYDDWSILTSLAPFRGVEQLWNHRITVFDVVRDDDGSYRVTRTPYYCRLDDPHLRRIPFYQITIGSFQ